MPAIGPLIAKAAVTGNRSAQDLNSAQLPGRHIRLDEVEIEVEALAKYCHLMQVALRNDLPTSYLHVLAFPLQVYLMAARDFPFAMAGMVHIANSMTQHRAVGLDERVTFSVYAEGIRPHAKGVTVDLVGLAESAGEMVWQGRSTYLVRGRSMGSTSTSAAPPTSDSPSASAAPAEQIANVSALTAAATWRVGADLGRRYAAVAGDVNPIHLNPLAAKAFGFPQAIAHGMWTHARALGALEGRLNGRHTVSVEFRKPILLPSTVTFRTRATQAGYAFAVTDRGGSREHMIGVVDHEVDPLAGPHRPRF